MLIMEKDPDLCCNGNSNWMLGQMVKGKANPESVSEWEGNDNFY